MRFLLLLLLVIVNYATAWCFPLKVSGVDTTQTAILIRDLRFGVDLVSENIDRSLIPASIMKGVTTASMLNLADASERFATPIVARGRIKGNTLEGDLAIEVCGDPTIESRFFAQTSGFADSIVAALKRCGIDTIAGALIVDGSNFVDATTPPGWQAEDIPWPYGARLQGANFRDNRFTLEVPSKRTTPYIPDLKVDIKRNKSRKVKIDRRDGSETVTVSGRLRRAVSESLAMPYPAKPMEYEVEQAIRDAGIVIKGGDVPESYVQTTIYTHLSPTFGEIMKSLMHRSDNLMAEGMLRAIAPGGTRAEAINEEKQIWAMAGLSEHGVRIVDGSGLSRSNRLTARFLADINRYMLGIEFGNDYTSLFPRAGRDGTLRYFLRDTALEGKVALKTGSMKGVQSYCGYMFDDEGRPSHIIVFIANDFKCSRAALKNGFQRLLLELFDVSLQSETENPDEEELDPEEQPSEEQADSEAETDDI